MAIPLFHRHKASVETTGQSYSSINLSTLLGGAFSLLAIFVSVSAAFLFYRDYSRSLTDEFFHRSESELQQISLQIDKSLRSVQQQLRLLAQDNSVRITLMLDVDIQLQERLDQHHKHYGGLLHFVEKNSGSLPIFSQRSQANRTHLNQYDWNKASEGEVLQEVQGRVVMGFIEEINRKEQVLGRVGSLYALDGFKIDVLSSSGHEPNLYLKNNHGELIDASDSSVIQAASIGRVIRKNSNWYELNAEAFSGYIKPLPLYPQIYYAVSNQPLKAAQSSGLMTALWLTLSVSLLGILIGLFITRVISRPLLEIMQMATQVADGEAPAKLLKPSPVNEIQGFAHSLFKIMQTLKKDEERILHQANYDFLTGLPNRSLFLDRFHRGIERAKRDQSRIALMFIDLDKFKDINDTLGHDSGDQLLKEAAKRLQASIRSTDTVARLGGDEFTLLMADIQSISDVETSTSQLLQRMARAYEFEGQEVFCSASIGVTLYPDDGDSVNRLLQNADSAMYQAKKLGRNTVQFYTAEMNQHAQLRRGLEINLRKALERQEFHLEYQPVFNNQGRTVLGAEALLRWRQGGEKNISPEVFIPIAEETGLIVALGDWVLEQACHDAVEWQHLGLNPLHVAVNLSSRQFQHNAIEHSVDRALTLSGLKPQQLIVEITESLLLGNNEKTLNCLRNFRQNGIGIAIDDFGTGYSSLSYLKRFPVNIIKIDRSFIRDIPDDTEDRALVDAIISIGDALQMEIIAEGVETKEQLGYLQNRSCAQIQGFYLGQPMKHDKFIEWVQTSAGRQSQDDSKSGGKG